MRFLAVLNIDMCAHVMRRPAFCFGFCNSDPLRMAKTEKYRTLFGSTTPKAWADSGLHGLDITSHFVVRIATCFQVKDYFLVDSKDPSSVMQIDLCGGVFGLPEFAKAPPVHTFASILEAELKEVRRLSAVFSRNQSGP